MESTKSILESLGYNLKDCGSYWKSTALYREGNNENALTIYKNIGDKELIVDHVTGQKMGLKRLIGLTIGISGGQIDDWLKNKNLILPEREDCEPKLDKIATVYDDSLYGDLVPDYSYWTGRGISKETIKRFKGGLAKTGKLKDRYVFGILNSKNETIGWIGRAIGDKNPKYKIVNKKTNFIWPAYLNNNIINKTKEVIITESPADVLSFYECGIENVLCSFGVEISFPLITYLLKISPKRIIINFNRDSVREDKDSNTGELAARKMYNRLAKYFDRRILGIRFPSKKDMNEQLMALGPQSIKDWYNYAN